MPRPGDQAVLAAAGEIGETVVIKAPDQMGKSSLLASYLHACQNEGKQVALNDALDINDGETPDIKTQPMMVSYVRKKVLVKTAGPVTIVFDEVNRVMRQSYQGDFSPCREAFTTAEAASAGQRWIWCWSSPRSRIF